tara:strand:- start:277 stop:471 length:195 start_codon:yes stop_codon:yes gene_type:complete
MCIENGVYGTVIQPIIAHTPYCPRPTINKDILFAGLKKIAAVSPARKWNQDTGTEDGQLHTVEI